MTLIRNKTQQLNNETTSVIRHLNSNEEFKEYSKKYLSFIAPFVHEDTAIFFDFSIVNNISQSLKIFIKPYDLNNFIDITIAKRNFEDMEKYTDKTLNEFRQKLNPPT